MKRKKIHKPHLLTAVTIIAVFIFIIALGVKRSPFNTEGKEEIYVKIITADCSECISFEELSDSFSENLYVRGIQHHKIGWRTTQDIISFYNIKKLPAVIVQGYPKAIAPYLPGYELRKNAYVWESAAPYYSLDDETVKGLVSYTIINPLCPECQDISRLPEFLSRLGIHFVNDTVTDAKSAQDLIEKYNIQILPTIIFDSELSEYAVVVNRWNEFGTVETDGSFVAREISAIGMPYYDINAGVKGLVKMTYIIDSTCTDCYDISLHKQALQKYNIKISQEEVVDVLDENGRQLAKKYKIEQVPTFILSKEASDYDSLMNSWSQVGTIEDDGTLVFRNLELMNGKYVEVE